MVYVIDWYDPAAKPALEADVLLIHAMFDDQNLDIRRCHWTNVYPGASFELS